MQDIGALLMLAAWRPRFVEMFYEWPAKHLHGLGRFDSCLPHDPGTRHDPARQNEETEVLTDTCLVASTIRTSHALIPALAHEKSASDDQLCLGRPDLAIDACVIAAHACATEMAATDEHVTMNEIRHLRILTKALIIALEIRLSPHCLTHIILDDFRRAHDVAIQVKNIRSMPYADLYLLLLITNASHDKFSPDIYTEWCNIVAENNPPLRIWPTAPYFHFAFRASRSGTPFFAWHPFITRVLCRHQRDFAVRRTKLVCETRKFIFFLGQRTVICNFDSSVF